MSWLSDKWGGGKVNLEEALDAASKALFDDMWIEAGGTITSPTTYGLNGTNDLTYKEVVRIMEFNSLCKTSHLDYSGMFSHVNDIRALFPINTPSDCPTAATFENTFQDCQKLEKIIFTTKLGWMGTDVRVSNGNRMFMRCYNLKTVEGVLDISYITSGDNIPALNECNQLADIKLKGLKCSTTRLCCPKLSLQTMQYLVNNAANTTAITVTVHADVFAKLTGDTSNGAAKALSEQELKDWGQILTDAAARQITFAAA